MVGVVVYDMVGYGVYWYDIEVGVDGFVDDV